jgi:signal transduction histidine kinase/DNA-binding response OmpR family regulator/purine-cytosine permease-like protein
MMEDFALRYTSKRARKWSYSRIAITSLGIVSFMVLEAIGGAITLSYGFINAVYAILALVAVVFISGMPISYYAAKYGVDIDLLSRGAGFGYMGSTITSLIYASFTFIFFALEAAIMAMALQLWLQVPLTIGYAVSALVVIPLVSHGITNISRFQVWTQPIWFILQMLPLIYVFNHPNGDLASWMNFNGDAGEDAQQFDIILFGSASAILLSLVAQIGEQVDFLRFLPVPKSKSNKKKWWFAVVIAGPGWVIFGAGKLLLGSFLAYFALTHNIDRELANDPVHMYQVAFSFVFNDTTFSVAIAAIFVIISQLKINVANAYAGSLAWSNFFSRLTHSHPGRVVWMVFNILIALLLMELGVYQTIESMLQVYSVLVLAWLSSVVADLIINKPLGISPPHIEFRRSKLYDINPVGVISMILASFFGFLAHSGILGPLAKALGSYIAFIIPFITVPIIGLLTQGKYYLINTTDEETTINDICCICENSFDKEDMAYCPAYKQTICSLCCTLDARCADKCRDKATFSAQIKSFFKRHFSSTTTIVASTAIAQWIIVTSILSSIIASVLFLIYKQIPQNSYELDSLFTSLLYKIFFFLMIIIGVVSWLFTLARESSRSTLKELREQTSALVSEIKAHEKTSKAFQVAIKTAESANQAKSRYLAGLSHELRTPLNVLLGYAQLLAKDQALREDTRQSINIMKRNGEHLADLIEGLLEVSTIEAGRLSVHRDEVQLRPLLEQLVNMFKLQAASKGLEFKYHFPSYLPEFVTVDKQRFRQILINLISNAIKFTQQGTVSFNVLYRNEVGYFEIKDTGVGILDKDKELVFKPFERISDSTNTLPGTGLGLTISRALSELMGGDISLISEIDKGSCFKLSLLLPKIAKGQINNSSENTINGYSGHRKTVLVVDDEQAQRELIKDIMTPIGFKVICADSAFSAISLLKSKGIDIILMDLKMPAVNGWQAAKQIRELKFLQPIIIVSANVRDLEISNTADGQHNDYLSKPIDINILLEKIGYWLNLNWQHLPTTVASNKSKINNRSLVSKNQYKALKITAEIGYLSGFINKLNKINEEYIFPDNIYRQLKDYAQQCQFQIIIKNLDNLIETSNYNISDGLKKHDSKNNND